MKIKRIVLAIESAIGGGSLSILEDQEEIDFWVGVRSVSRSEDLLREISALLSKNGLTKKDIAMIAVSDNAGSHTGIRIGHSTALGLGKVLNCSVKKVSTLSAIASCFEEKGSLCVAISTNKRHVIFQEFGSDVERFNENFVTSSYESFLQTIAGNRFDKIIVNESFYHLLKGDKTLDENFYKKIVNAGTNIAKYIGFKGINGFASDNDKS